MGFKERMGFLVIGAVLVIAALAYAITHPILLRITEGPLPGDRRLILLSPFRDREPERIAAQFLDRLRSGQCKDAIAALEWSDEKKKLICEKEASIPFVDLRLIDRIDQPMSVTLRYIWYSDSGPSGRIGSFIKLQVSGNQGKRRIIEYDRSY